MRVIVTGSRAYPDRDQVWRALDEQMLDALFYGGADWFVVSVGDCPTGADKHARDWVFQRVVEGFPVRCEIFYATWDAHGRAAGPIRNQQMVEVGGRRILAFYAPPPARNRGTAGCAKLARDAGIPVREYGRPAAGYEQETLPL